MVEDLISEEDLFPIIAMFSVRVNRDIPSLSRRIVSMLMDL